MFERGITLYRGHYIPVDFVIHSLALLRSQGLPLEQFSERCRADTQGATPPVGELDTELFHALLRQVESHYGSPAFGLALASPLHGILLSRMVHLFLSAPNLFIAIKAMQQISQSANLLLKIRLQERAEDFLLVLDSGIGSGERPQVISEITLGMLWCLLRHLAPVLRDPAEVHISHPLSGPTAPYKKFFGKGWRLRFDSAQDGLLFSKRDALQANPRQDPELFQLVGQLVQQRLSQNLNYAAARQEQDWLRLSRSHLLANLQRGQCGIEALASALHITPRTLQRKLKAYQLTFSALLDQCRQELAMQLLHQHRLPLKVISAQLGFTSMQSLRRAFVRWYGKAPRSYRDIAG